MSSVDSEWLSDALKVVSGGVSPRVGLILGSGLGGIAARIESAQSVRYSDIPGFPISTAIGHKGQLTLGTLDGVSVAVMEGRFHAYEGYCGEQLERPIQLMHALGVRFLVVTNAAGGLNPNFQVGDVVVIRDHVNWMRSTANTSRDHALSGIRAGGATRSWYDSDLTNLAITASRAAGHRGLAGVYIGMTGPNYETRSEYRFLRQVGDLVGMSTIPEVNAACRLGMRVAGFSVVSNECNPDRLEPTDGAQVVTAVSQASERLSGMIRHVISQF